VYQLEHEMPPDELYEWAILLAEEAEEAQKRENELRNQRPPGRGKKSR
jgi:hypothetical protein